VDLYFARVPWLYRGVMDRANNVAAMPFAVTRGKTDYDASQDWQNKLQFLPDPVRLFKKLEMSLAMTGKAYLFLETNPAGFVKRALYCSPYSVEEVYDKNSGELVGYKRKVGTQGQRMDVAPSNIVAMYLPDYLTENGPGTSSPASAALTASGVLYNADRFIANYFERGAIKATVITVDGGSQQEAERLRSWWGDVVAGIKNAWAAVVLRMKEVKATVIGEGLESLQNNELTSERRQDIATALGVPESRLWSAAANYATRVEDEKAYFNSTIVPDCELIAEAFNSQLFTSSHRMEGFKLRFRPETMDIFQEDTNQQSQAAKAFIEFLVGCPTAEICRETAAMIGFELEDSFLAAIDAYFADKEAKEEEMAAQLAAQPAPGTQEPEEEGEEEDDARGEPNPQELRSVLSAWKRKATYALKLGHSANVEFTSDVIPLALQGAIAGQLEDARSEEDVKLLFASAWRGYP
jgi:HK97 family phage portal protein